jgi:hypothetical protein
VARPRTPLGDLLAQRSKQASRTVGGDSDSFAPHVKGWRCQVNWRLELTATGIPVVYTYLIVAYYNAWGLDSPGRPHSSVASDLLLA